MIGFGGIGAVHKAAYDALLKEGVPIRLVAVCDKNTESIKQVSSTNLGTVDVGSFEGVSFYSDCDELIEKEVFDVADICLPTFLHKDYTLKLLRAGKHVLCEKPMALSYGDCREMADFADKVGRELAVGQCLRFDPAYLYLNELVETGKLGELRRITMGRLSFLPRWGGWFTDTKKSGGCIFDFHIHDVDMLRFLLGEPQAVSSLSYLGDNAPQYVNTRFFYDGIIAEAEASFDESPTAPFDMWYRARFEKGSVVFAGGAVTVYPDDGKPYTAEIGNRDRIAAEISHFADVILRGVKNTVNSARIAAESIRLCELVSKSAELRGEAVGWEK